MIYLYFDVAYWGLPVYVVRAGEQGRFESVFEAGAAARRRFVYDVVLHGRIDGFEGLLGMVIARRAKVVVRTF